MLYDEYFFSIDLPKTLLLEWSASLGIVPVTLLLSFFARESPFAYETGQSCVRAVVHVFVCVCVCVRVLCVVCVCVCVCVRACRVRVSD